MSLTATKKLFLFVWTFCTAIVLVLIWVPKYLPMIDLPQMGEQVSILLNINNPTYAFRDAYIVQWLTPYGLGTLAAYGLSHIFGIFTALKILLSLGILGLPFCMLLLTRQSQGDDWWAIAGFPLALGFSFYWGFFNYILAVPLALLFIWLGIRYLSQPTTLNILSILFLSLLLTLVHSFTAYLSAAILIPRLLLIRGSFLMKSRRAAPIIIFPLLAALWFGSATDKFSTVIYWFSLKEFLERLWQWPAILFGAAAAPLEWAAGICLLLFLALGSQTKKERSAWIPLAAAFLIYLFFPTIFYAWGASPRTAVFFVPFLLLGLAPTPDIRLQTASRFLISAGSAAWLVLLVFRFTGFDQRARLLDPIFDRIEPNKRVMALVFNKKDPSIPGFTWTHQPAWVQTYKGVYYQYSLSSIYPQNVVIHPPNLMPRLRTYGYFSDHPDKFTWAKGGCFDYWIVGSLKDRTGEIFKGHLDEVRLLCQSGMWWLYERKIPSAWQPPEPCLEITGRRTDQPPLRHARR